MTLPDHRINPGIGRREMLKGAGALGLGALAANALNASPLERGSALGFTNSCVLTPEQNPGPNWRLTLLNRRNITEGLPGIPLSVYFKVVRALDCQPIPGLALDYWQTDHRGIYSAVAHQGTVGQTWLRGYQVTPSNGIVHFNTVYPGWYVGRATHLHVKIFMNTTTVFDTQIYFPEHITRAVYQTPVYAARGLGDTLNKNDPWFLPETVLPVRSLRTNLGGGKFPTRLYAGMTLVLDI